MDNILSFSSAGEASCGQQSENTPEKVPSRHLCVSTGCSENIARRDG